MANPLTIGQVSLLFVGFLPFISVGSGADPVRRGRNRTSKQYLRLLCELLAVWEKEAVVLGSRMVPRERETPMGFSLFL